MLSFCNLYVIFILKKGISKAVKTIFPIYKY